MPEIADVTDDTFEHEVLESGIPVLVDFWGDHCAACRQISPILKEIAGEHAGDLKVVKIHAAENPRAAARFGVRAMPTVLIFSDGTVRGQLVSRPESSPAFDRVQGPLAALRSLGVTTAMPRSRALRAALGHALGARPDTRLALRVRRRTSGTGH